jgi:hypothetical protein
VQPRRLGTANDWVALGTGPLDLVSLAADGSLWEWERGGAMGSSRKPVKLANIFEVPAVSRQTKGSKE